MYSTPNGAQEQAEEGEVSGGESGDEQGEWESNGEGEGDDDVDSSEEEEEEEAEPPRSERRSNLTMTLRGNVVRQLLPLGSRRSALGPLLQRRLKKLPSTPARRRPSHPRLCPR